MISAAIKPPLLPSRMSAPAPGKALRRLFLTLFLRGRGARGLSQKSAPTSVGQKLLLTLLLYAAIGCTSFPIARQGVFGLAVYLHAMTFMFLGMFVASSAGEILFNKEEADILLHRPVDARTLLWSKVRVLVEVSLWLAGAFNVAGFFAGLICPDGGWRFPIAHAVSTALEALFCGSCVVLVYQLCLRWFGRERLEGLMTTTQVAVSIAVVASSQILPRVVSHLGHFLTPSKSSWWIGLLPPAWFAGFDDALAGSGAFISWIMGAIGVSVTLAILLLAFGKLARDYETGLQAMSETVSKRKPARAGRRWIERLVDTPPLRWWMREPVSRAAFLLTAAYLIRDRETKLRVYPGIAPMLVIPFVFLFQGGGGFGGEFGIAFSGGYLGLIPLISLSMLQYSQQWQASDIFRLAPMRGPAAICHGARRAVLCFLTLPVLCIVAGVIWLAHGLNSQLLLLLPGILAVPVYALVPGLLGGAVPLATPSEEAKSVGRGVSMILVMFISMALSGVAAICWSQGCMRLLLAAETVIVIVLYTVMRRAQGKVRWRSAE